MNKFEVVLLFSPELATNKLDEEVNKFTNFINENQGKIVNTEDWGIRDLTYNINKFKKAFYKFFQIEVTGSKLDLIKKDFNQSDNVLRYLFVKVKSHQELPTKLNYEKK